MKSFLLVVMVAFCMVVSGCKEEKVEVAVQVTKTSKQEKSQSDDISKIFGAWKSSNSRGSNSGCPNTLLITNDSVSWNIRPNEQPKRTYYKLMEDKSIMVYQTGEVEWFSIVQLPSGNIRTFGHIGDNEYIKTSVEDIESINHADERYYEEFYKSEGKISGPTCDSR